jgi:outer membrane immunogenic protein
MNSFKAATMLLLLTSVSAVAADLPSIKSGSLAAPGAIWAGFYAGLNAGGMWGNANSVNVTTMPISGSEASDPSLDFTKTALGGAANTGAIYTGTQRGFIGGGQLGYNHVVTFGKNQFLAGLELDLQGVAGDGGNNPGYVAYLPVIGLSYSSVSVHNSTSYIGTVRSRIGCLITPTVMIYGTGGLAYGRVSTTFARWSLDYPTTYGAWGEGLNSYAAVKSGWTAGGGGEWMFSPSWSVKAEYLYYDLGSLASNTSTIRYNLKDSFVRITHVSTYAPRFNGNIVRAGVNYHFNSSSAPVVAKF